MSCPDALRFAALCDGEASENEASALEAHLEGCARCRACSDAIVGARAALLALPLPKASPGFSARVLAGRARPRWPMALALATSVAAALIVLGDGKGSFTARGGAASDQGLRVFAAAVAGEPAAEVEDTAASDAVFSFSVFRAAQTPPYAMLFAIDAASEVHWFYPAHMDPQASPSSVPLRHVGWSLLPQAVRMASAAKGKAHFILLTSEAPLDVAAIEARISRGELDVPAGVRVSRVDVQLH